MIKLVKLEGNPEGIAERNARCEELKISCPSIDWDKHMVKTIDDEFAPYYMWLKEIEAETNIELIEDTILNLNNIYVSSLNWNTDMRLTNYKLTNDYSLYGVCDNASQVIEYMSVREYDEDKEYLIVLTPILKDNQPDRDGWRWEKWGEYIGTQKSNADYLADESSIDMVYVFDVSEVVKTNNLTD